MAQWKGKQSCTGSLSCWLRLQGNTWMFSLSRGWALGPAMQKSYLPSLLLRILSHCAAMSEEESSPRSPMEAQEKQPNPQRSSVVGSTQYLIFSSLYRACGRPKGALPLLWLQLYLHQHLCSTSPARVQPKHGKLSR
jgi:hypothetical protein